MLLSSLLLLLLLSLSLRRCQRCKRCQRCQMKLRKKREYIADGQYKKTTKRSLTCARACAHNAQLWIRRHWEWITWLSVVCGVAYVRCNARRNSANDPAHIRNRMCHMNGTVWHRSPRTHNESMAWLGSSTYILYRVYFIWEFASVLMADIDHIITFFGMDSVRAVPLWFESWRMSAIGPGVDSFAGRVRRPGQYISGVQRTLMIVSHARWGKKIYICNWCISVPCRHYMQ